MQTLDWLVIAIYLLGMLALAAWLSRAQGSREDYFLGGRNMPGWTLAVSIIATQCSTNSLLGAPAFVGFTAGGGLIWLQYELAIPLAMLALALVFRPVYLSGSISVYAFLEQRLGRPSRLTASACFLLFRGIATGVVAYGVASILSLITGVSYGLAVALLMLVTITYDVLGGMRAVVLSDVIQMVLLVTAVIAALVGLGGDFFLHWDTLGARTQTLHNDWGLTSGDHYGFWPMLFGGLFLYLAYYGCDQSQAQRLLATGSSKTLSRVLILNGVLRFPLVALYCSLGIGLAAYAVTHPEFIASLPKTSNGDPNFNMVFPAYVLREFWPGFTGLAMVGLFAAAMSSIDSALNSLSASTLEDFVLGFHKPSESRLFWLSKLITLGWGLFAIAFSFAVEHIAATVLEAINKVGSMANGPLLGLFLTALLTPRVGSRIALTGFFVGLGTNMALMLFSPQTSWLWWNVAGAISALATTALLAGLSGPRPLGEVPGEIATYLLAPRDIRQLGTILGGSFGVILGGLILLQYLSNPL